MFLYSVELMIFHSLAGSAVASYIALRRSFVRDRPCIEYMVFWERGYGACLVSGYFWKPDPC